MTLHVCKTDEEIKEAIHHSSDTVTSEELDEAKRLYEDVYDRPIVTPLGNYLEALYVLTDEECGDWAGYIDFARYLKDLILDMDNMFTLIKTDHGYCIVCEDLPDPNELPDLPDDACINA